MIAMTSSGFEPSGTSTASPRRTSRSTRLSSPTSSTPLGTTSSFMRGAASSAFWIITVVLRSTP